MKNKTIIILAFLIIFVLSACGEKTATPTVESVEPTAPASATATPDLCSKENLPGEVSKVNDLMREFDDYSRLASSTPQDKLLQVIPPMQEVRRRAETQAVPNCLRDLKALQINHMNTVIEILMVFMSNAQAEGVNQGIAQARDLHMKYDIEIASLLGLTMVAPPTGDAPILPAATTPPGSAATQPSGLSVLNPGPNEVTLLSSPDATSDGVATLAADLSTVAFGRTADGLWIQVEVPGKPGQKAWVDASLVQVSGELPVVTP